LWLERITLKDFRCFYGEQSIELSTDPARNVTLIHSENGVGKTTLLNALLWCFYGATAGQGNTRAAL
jgi:DNA sulfur modification protein DndD